MNEEKLLANLTFPFRLKTIKIRKLKAEIDNYKPSYNYIFISGTVFLFTFIVFCFNINDYYNYFMQISDNITNFTNFYPTINRINMYILIILFISLITTFSFYKTQLLKRQQLIEEYNKLRIDIINSIDDEFCKDDQTCNCKEDYYKFMYSIDIDLVFK